MPFPKKHIYKDGSPGALREKLGRTLTSIKKEISSAVRPAQARRAFVASKLLGKE